MRRQKLSLITFLLIAIPLITIPLITPSSAVIQAPAFAGETIQTLASFSFGGTPQTQFIRFPTCKPNQGYQTPIDLSEPFTPDLQASVQLSKQAYIVPKKAVLINPGHFAQVIDLPSTPKSYLRFKGVDYLFTQVHFHTGANNNEGSDHTLNGKRFPLETHIVFRQEKYGTLRNAETYKDGVLIVGVFYKIGQFNNILDNILANIGRIAETNATAIFEPDQSVASVANLFPDLRSKFYYYEGSLEAPPCEQTIKWIVYDTPLQLSLQQMNSFRGVLRTPDGSLQIKSWRFTQARNGRNVYVGGLTPNQSSSADSFSELFDLNYSTG